MSSNSGGRTKKRGRAMGLTLAGSPLVGRNMKRVGKSPGPTSSPKSAGPKGVAMALATDESDIVLDRLEKEIVSLLKAGGSKKNAVRRRLRLGINEVTKFLEATAAEAVASSSAEKSSSRSTAPAAIVLVCRDVRPPRLVEHLHALVSLTSTPHLVLSAPSSSLGRIFGCKTMAALAICPPRCSAPQPPPPTTTTTTPAGPDLLPSATKGVGGGSGGNEGGSGGGEKAKLPLPFETTSSNSNGGGSGQTDVEDPDAGESSARAGGMGNTTGDDEGGQEGKRVPGGAAAGVVRTPPAATAAATAEAAGAKDTGGEERGVREGGGAVPVGRDGVRRQDEGEGRGVGKGAREGGVTDAWDAMDEDVDSLVEFLRRKVKVRAPL